MGCASSKQKLQEAAASPETPPVPEFDWVQCKEWDDYLRFTRKGAAVNGFAQELKNLDDFRNFFRLVRTYADTEYPNQAAARTTEDMEKLNLLMPTGKFFDAEVLGLFVLNDSLINLTYQFVVVICKDEQMVLHDEGAPPEEKMVIGATLTTEEREEVQQKVLEMMASFKEDEAKLGQVDIKIIAGNEMWQARLKGESPTPYKKPLRPGQPKALSRLNTVPRSEDEEEHRLIPTVCLRAVYQYAERRFRGNTIWDGGEFPLYVDDKKYKYNTRLLVSRREYRGDITEFGTPYRIKYMSGGPATVPDMIYRSIDRATELNGVEDLHLIVAIDPKQKWPKLGDYKTSEVFLAAEAALWEEAKRLNELGIGHEMRLNVHMGVDIKRQLFVGDLPTVQKTQCKRTEAFYEGFEDMFNVTLKAVSRNPKSLVRAMERQRKCLPMMHFMQDDVAPLDAATKKWNKWLLKSKRNFVDISFPDLNTTPLASVAARRWIDKNFRHKNMKVMDMCQPLYIEQPKRNESRLLRGVRVFAVHDSRCDPNTIVGVVATVGIPSLVDDKGEEAPWSRVSIRSVVQAALLHQVLQWRREGLVYDGNVKCHIITGEYWRTFKLDKKENFKLHDDSEHFEERLHRSRRGDPRILLFTMDPPVPTDEINFHRREKPESLSLVDRLNLKARYETVLPRHEDDLTPEELENETPEEKQDREDAWESLIMKIDSFILPELDGTNLPDGARQRRKQRLRQYWQRKREAINKRFMEPPKRTLSELERFAEQAGKDLKERDAKLAIQRAEAEGRTAAATDEKHALAVLEGRISTEDEDEVNLEEWQKDFHIRIAGPRNSNIRRGVLLESSNVSNVTTRKPWLETDDPESFDLGLMPSPISMSTPGLDMLADYDDTDKEMDSIIGAFLKIQEEDDDEAEDEADATEPVSTDEDKLDTAPETTGEEKVAPNVVNKEVVAEVEEKAPGKEETKEDVTEAKQETPVEEDKKEIVTEVKEETPAESDKGEAVSVVDETPAVMEKAKAEAVDADKPPEADVKVVKAEAEAEVTETPAVTEAKQDAVPEVSETTEDKVDKD